MAKFFIQGKGQVDLNQNDFVTEGGEGKIFSKGNVVYKIYSDLKKMIPSSKIQELSILDLPNIIRPKDILLDQKNQISGFTMDLVHGIPLCKLFTNDFRNNNKVQPTSINKLVENMINTIVFIHDKKCLLVDGNEMNYLVDKKTFEIPYFIDVNSYQTPSFPATVIMSSIRDWSSPTFNKLTDWFSFAIVSCQLFIGIHPFKGKHPKYKPNQMEDRMKANISVFNKDVHVPATCRDFSYIPDDFQNWFIDLFEKGVRVPPPKVTGLLNIKQIKVNIVQTTNHFEIQFVSDFKDEIIKVKFYNGVRCVTTTEKIWINKTDSSITSPDVDVVLTNKMLDPILVKIEKGFLALFNFKKKEFITSQIGCTEKIIIDNTIYVRYEGNLIEVTLNEFGDKIIPSVKHVWNIMPKSSQFLKGMIYQNVLGKAYLVIPKPEVSKNSSCQILYIPELNGYRIMNGKYENKVCMITGYQNNIYSKIILRFDDSGKYDCRIIDDVDPNIINFIVLDNGLCISINDDDSIELFSRSLKVTKIDCIKDHDINSSMILCNDGMKVLFYKNNELYSMSMKK